MFESERLRAGRTTRRVRALRVWHALYITGYFSRSTMQAVILMCWERGGLDGPAPALLNPRLGKAAILAGPGRALTT